MTPTATFLLALGMSMDAFAASISKGATLRQPRFREALRTGAIFGVVEAATPLIGWGLGLVASRYIAAWDHWLAFTRSEEHTSELQSLTRISYALCSLKKQT